MSSRMPRQLRGAQLGQLGGVSEGFLMDRNQVRLYSSFHMLFSTFPGMRVLQFVLPTIIWDSHGQFSKKKKRVEVYCIECALRKGSNKRFLIKRNREAEMQEREREHRVGI